MCNISTVFTKENSIDGDGYVSQEFQIENFSVLDVFHVLINSGWSSKERKAHL